MTSSLFLSLIAVLFVAVVHVSAGSLHRGAAARPWWLAGASGLSVAYVFVHLLPELGEMQARWLEENPARPLVWLQSQIYVVALIGVLVSLGFERVTKGERARERFWVHLGAFAFYNVLIGGFALRLAGVVPTILAAIAFGAHILANDHALTVQYGTLYRRFGRWVLAAAILAGWLIAAVWEPRLIVVAVLLGLLSGSMMLSVLKDELADERVGQFRTFAVGALVYAVLLIALTYSQYAARRGAEPAPDGVTARD